MADEDGFESFTVSDADLHAALNPGAWRRPTKHQQIYGVWADDSDEDQPTRGNDNKYSSSSRKRDSAPIGFVSGGVKQGSKVVKIGEKEDDDDDDEGDKDEEMKADWPEQRPSLGVPRAKRKETGFAGLRDSGSSQLGSWERHTKGIGSKLLGKMGYKGKGLGSKGDGIVEPVLAVKRPGRAALGAYGPEASAPKTADQVQASDQSGSDSEGNQRSKFQASGNWRKAQATKRRQKFKTVEELVEEGGSLAGRLDALGVEPKEKTKIIDMTGRQQRVYSGYDAFRNRTAAVDEVEPLEQLTAEQQQTVGFDVPELRHNLHLLLQVTEEDIVRTHRHVRNLHDRRIALKHDREKLKEKLEIETENSSRTKEALDLVQEMGEKFDAQELSLEMCLEYFTRLKSEYEDEWLLFNLVSLVPAVALPLLKQLYSNQWQPLIEPDRGFDQLLQWRRILLAQSQDQSGRGRTMNEYDRLVWHAWMPQVRRCIQSDWQPPQTTRENALLIQLIRLWHDLLPSWLLANLFDQLITPKLQLTLDNWNPVTDTVPVHVWLEPWVQILGWDRFQPLSTTMLHKLAGALSNWEPRDPSAKMILEPWRGVLPAGVLERFLHQHVVPKLDQVLAQSLIVNPANQKLEPWHWVVDNWFDVIGKNVMAQLLLKHFFPKWHNALYLWLVSPKPNLCEIEQWYNGWKRLLPPPLLDVPLIKDQLTLGLEQMNRVLNGGCAVAPRSQNQQPAPVFGQAPKPLLSLLVKGNQQQPAGTFKQILEQSAAENQVPFLPVAPPKFREGRPVYWLGKLQVYLDGNVAFALLPNETSWQPMGLEHMLKIAMQ